MHTYKKNTCRSYMQFTHTHTPYIQIACTHAQIYTYMRKDLTYIHTYMHRYVQITHAYIHARIWYTHTHKHAHTDHLMKFDSKLPPIRTGQAW